VGRREIDRTKNIKIKTRRHGQEEFVEWSLLLNR
jgi:hypothetical protein